MRRTSTTRLPPALSEQIDKDGSQNTWKRKKQVIGRKQGRKEERRQLKQRRAAFSSSSKSSDLLPSRKRPVDDRQKNEPVKKKIRLTGQPTASQQPHTKLKDITPIPATLRSQHTSKGHGLRDTLEPILRSRPISRRSLNNIIDDQSQEDRAEDGRIAWLETKVGGLKGSGTVKQSASFRDELDDLMDDIDRIMPVNTPAPETSSEHQYHKGSEICESMRFLAVERNEEKDEEEPLITNSPIGGNYRTSFVGANDQTSTSLAESRYIPPHLRSRPNNDSETQLKLSRQVKGLLNRLSEQNMGLIVASIEDLYRNHRRHDVTFTLTTLIVDGISSHSSHLDSFIVLHASLVTSLYRIIGIDFVAHFIQFLITSYEQHYQVWNGNNSINLTDGEPRGKECLNLAVLLSELYNFQVISCVLVYDVIRGLLDSLNEFDVELLLKIVRRSGPQLRHDDPSALKDIIQTVHTKMSTKQQETINSRTHFMIETLTNLKNNKVKHVVGQDSRFESAGRMKKFLTGLAKKHHIIINDPLRISLEDIHSSEKKGKWWLVGSASGGEPLFHRTSMEDKYSASKDHSVQAADSLLQLARKQGMNTDVRRGIFVVLMSSNDYVDACERLSQLNLSEVQQREIVRVVLHCLGNERQYNPYYTLVVQQLCRTSHSFKVTLQFCLWDFLRELGEKSVGGAEIINGLHKDDAHLPFELNRISPARRLNISRAYAWWTAKGCCSLTILKPVDFTVLQTQSRDFFRDFFFQLFVSSQVSSPAISSNAEAAGYLSGPRIRETLERVFIKARRFPTLTQGLIYFLTDVLRGDNGTNNEVVSGTFSWACDVARDTLRTGTNVVA